MKPLLLAILVAMERISITCRGLFEPLLVVKATTLAGTSAQNLSCVNLELGAIGNVLCGSRSIQALLLFLSFFHFFGKCSTFP